MAVPDEKVEYIRLRGFGKVVERKTTTFGELTKPEGIRIYCVRKYF